MKKKLLIPTLILAVALVFGACSKEPAPGTDSSPDPSTSSEPPVDSNSDSNSEETPKVTPEDMVKDLIKDEYADLEVTAEILEKKAIIPGSSIPVTVKIKNNGDETIVFTHGSGSSATPDALMMSVSGLQPVMPKDKLGVQTMDLRVDELKPGEELEYVLYVMAIEPVETFDEMTSVLYMKDESYIADYDWQSDADFASFVNAPTGEYIGAVYFTYFIQEEGADENSNITGAATGYNTAEVSITVTE